MNLQSFNPGNMKIPKRGAAFVRISFKSGAVAISGTATELMGLKAFDQIEFLQNKDAPTEWYIRKCKENEEGFVLRPHKEQKNNQLMFNAVDITTRIANSIDFTGDSGRCNIGTEPIGLQGQHYWELITAMFHKSK